MLSKFGTTLTYLISNTYLIHIHIWFTYDTSVNESEHFSMCWLADSVNNSLDFIRIHHLGEYLSRFGQVSQLCRRISGLYLRSHKRCRIDCSTNNSMNSVENLQNSKREWNSNSRQCVSHIDGEPLHQHMAYVIIHFELKVVEDLIRKAAIHW
jgi:hypothetical protein